MTNWSVLVETNCTDPDRLDEFHEWYNGTHLPDVLETPGVIRATRFESVGPAEGQPQFLAVYDVESDDLEAALAESNRIMAKKAEEGRMSDLMQVVTVKSYRQLYTTT